MPLAARATRHEAVAKIDEAAGSNEREKDRLLESNRMRRVGFLFQKCAGAYMGGTSNVRAVKKGGSGEVTAFEGDIPAELALFNGGRRLRTYFAARTDPRGGAANPAAGMNHRTRCNSLRVNRFIHFN